jgi:hypothetical protein
MDDHESGPLKSGFWAELREWLVAMTGLAALIVAVVTFWTTARISGLEDYLRSEISRRNADLDGLSAKTALAERLANEQAGRLSEIQVATTRITASSLAAQADLERVRSDVSDARQRLASARSSIDTIKDEYSRQTRVLDLFQRQQAYQIAAAQIITGTGLVQEGAPTGSLAIEYIKGMKSPAGQVFLNPYLQIVKDNIQKVCPRLKDWKPDLPDRGAEPPQPTIRYVKGASRERIAALTKEAQDRWSADYAKYVQKDDDYSKATLREMNRLWDDANDCVCSTLTTAEIGQGDICPGRNT